MTPIRITGHSGYVAGIDGNIVTQNVSVEPEDIEGHGTWDIVEFPSQEGVIPYAGTIHGIWKLPEELGGLTMMLLWSRVGQPIPELNPGDVLNPGSVALFNTYP